MSNQYVHFFCLLICMFRSIVTLSVVVYLPWISILYSTLVVPSFIPIYCPRSGFGIPEVVSLVHLSFLGCSLLVSPPLHPPVGPFTLRFLRSWSQGDTRCDDSPISSCFCLSQSQNDLVFFSTMKLRLIPVDTSYLFNDFFTSIILYVPFLCMPKTTWKIFTVGCICEKT